MAEIETTKAGGGSWEVPGVGSVTKSGWLSLRGELRTSDGTTYAVDVVGWTKRGADVLDAAGDRVGMWNRDGWRSYAGQVRWQGRVYQLRCDSQWRQQFTLLRDGRPLLEARASGWSRAKVALVGDLDALEPGLVLFVVWLVQTFVRISSAAA